MRVFVWSVMFFSLLPKAAWSNEKLMRAEQYYNELEYAKAIQVADQLLQSAGLRPAELLKAYEIKGLSLAGQDQIEEAFLVFQKLVAIDPDYNLGDVSPRLASPFYQAVATAGSQKGPFVLTHTPPSGLTRLAGQQLVAELTNNPYNMAKSVRLYFRSGDAGAWTSIEAEVLFQAQLLFSLPVDLEADQIQYHFAIMNRYGSILGTLASAEKPLSLTVKAQVVAQRTLATQPEQPAQNFQPSPRPQQGISGQTTPWYQTWWFWTAVGVVAVGASTGVVLGLTLPDDSITYTVRTQ